MSEDQLSAFLSKVKDSAELQERLAGACVAEEIISIANQSGFPLTKEDWHSCIDSVVSDLGDDELESLAGGTNCDCKRSRRTLGVGDVLERYNY